VFDEAKQTLTIDDAVDVTVLVLPFLNRRYLPNRGWKLYFERLPFCQLILLVRTNKDNTNVLDYHLLLHNLFSECQLHVYRIENGSIQAIQAQGYKMFYGALLCLTGCARHGNQPLVACNPRRVTRAV
jgi:hypothetical protein